ncbi:MAG: hypothetical protein N2662_02170 [Bacteroidales bacterium]|nr:hypothetical protein [Bacteroidales bacterium]
MKISQPNIIKNFIILLITVTLSSCKSDESTIVPVVTVEYELSLTNELAYLGVGMYVTVTKSPKNENFSIVDYHNSKFANKTIAQKTYGNGIIIYRKDFYDYQVFDLTCTYRSFEDYCQLKIDSENNYIFVCPCCNSEFIVTADGMPTNTSKAFKPLMQYFARVDGTTLVISNE